MRTPCCVFLQGEKDWQKYETARRLKKCVDRIRTQYRDDWKSKEMRIRQRAVALYFIDKVCMAQINVISFMSGSWPWKHVMNRLIQNSSLKALKAFASVTNISMGVHLLWKLYLFELKQNLKCRMVLWISIFLWCSWLWELVMKRRKERRLTQWAAAHFEWSISVCIQRWTARSMWWNLTFLVKTPLDTTTKSL